MGVELSYVKDKYKNQVDRCSSPPNFKVKNKAWLLCHNLMTTRPYNKLNIKRPGPFYIIVK